jgi:alpha-N-arabinofuranosidase
VAVHNQEKEELVIFAVNRNLEDGIELEADIHGYEGYAFEEHLILQHNDLKAVNSANGEIVRPEKQTGGKLDGTKLHVRLVPASWNVIRLIKRNKNG